MKKFLYVSLLLYTITSLLPLLKTPYWFVRIWDFPRMQLAVIALVLFIAALIKFREYILIIPLIALALDVYRLAPYSPLMKIESKMHDKHPDQFSVMIFNVLQTNEKKENLIRLIREKNPDFVFLFEVDKKWTDSLDALTEFSERKYDPLDNTYGIAFLGKKKVEKIDLNFLVEKGVPSYEIKWGELTIFAVHPKPPTPPIDSEHRDAELVLVAKKARKIKGPVLVLGDLNDVAWSHTTRLFRRISELLDPRVGRHPYGTFPALTTVLRFPLDYIFHSKELKLTHIEILPDIGSDHLPITAKLRVEGRPTP